MNKKRARKNAAAIAKGHVRALKRRGIKLDKQKRARKDGKPLSVAKLEKAVLAIKRAKAQESRIKTKAKPKVTKSAAKPKISERDSFIIESLERNHLAPEVRRKYLKSLSPLARKSLTKPATAKLPKKTERKTKRKSKSAKLTERDQFILASWNDFSESVQQDYFKKLSPAAKQRIEARQRERVKKRTHEEKQRDQEEAKRSLLPNAQRLRESLEQAIEPKTWEAIHRETPFDKTRNKAIIIQTSSEVKGAAEEAVKTSPAIDDGPNPNKFYAVIAIVTQYPPEASYGQRPLNSGDKSLTILYITAKSTKTREELPASIIEAIENIRSQLPGDAPLAIVGVYIRARTIEEK